MRIIDLNRLEVPASWQGNAIAARMDVTTPVNNHSKVWRDLKEPLQAISNNKCYYCEIIQERSDGAVDHFRPKKLYPWSAFSLHNYRFSCTYCNSRRKDSESGEIGGKGDHFPLIDESKRATCGEDEAHESPMLLDPCSPAEPGLLDFDESGVPIPTYSAENHSIKHERAKISINLYHLDHADLVDKRKILALAIQRKIMTADRLFLQTESGNASIDESFSEHVRSLAECISERAELSAFARRIVAGHRHLRWVDSLLNSA